MDTLDVAVQAHRTGGLLAPANPSTHGNRPESWLTPRANEPSADSNFVTRMGDRGQHCHVSLTTQAKAWATPEGMSGGKVSCGGKRKNELLLTGQVRENGSGKLNPRWVETLMGLPVGWTMASCLQPIASPASVAMMSFAGNAEDTTQTVHALGQIAVMTDNRTDELRLLGNGVVPATAAIAFKTLFAELL